MPTRGSRFAGELSMIMTSVSGAGWGEQEGRAASAKIRRIADCRLQIADWKRAASGECVVTGRRRLTTSAAKAGSWCAAVSARLKPCSTRCDIVQGCSGRSESAQECTARCESAQESATRCEGAQGCSGRSESAQGCSGRCGSAQECSGRCEIVQECSSRCESAQECST